MNSGQSMFRVLLGFLPSLFPSIVAAQGATLPQAIVENDGSPLIEPAWPQGPQGLRGNVSIGTNEKEVSVYWQVAAPGGVTTGRQAFALPFQPTAVATSSHFGEAYVAGLTSRGYTTIQRIQFGVPAVLTGVDPNGGGVASTMVLSQIEDIDEVYFDDIPGEQVVVSMVVDRTDSNRLFAQFWDSSLLYSVDTSTGTYSPIATAVDDGDPATLTIAALADNHNTMYCRLHSTHGFVYWIVDYGSDPVGAPTILLVDSNQDGVFDSHHSSSVSTGFDAVGLTTGYVD